MARNYNANHPTSVLPVSAKIFFCHSLIHSSDHPPLSLRAYFWSHLFICFFITSIIYPSFYSLTLTVLLMLVLLLPLSLIIYPTYSSYPPYNCVYSYSPFSFRLCFFFSSPSLLFLLVPFFPPDTKKSITNPRQLVSKYKDWVDSVYFA